MGDCVVGMGNCVVGMGNCVVRISTFKVVDLVIWSTMLAAKRSVRDRMVRSAVGRVSLTVEGMGIRA
jgi:hypothetical protein